MGRAALAAVVLVLGFPTRASSQEAGGEPPLLVVLTETGRTCNGLPVLTRHPDAATDLAALARGFSGRLLHLYRLEQRWLARTRGTAVEPAYLLRSSKEGGFPRVGFCLDAAAKPSAAYVDLHRRSQVSGRFGAADQIFPHELAHVILRQLAGEPPDGGAHQVHAIGVRTDRIVAFDEGFAEHVQIMAVDDPDAPPETLALARDSERRARAERDVARYARALEARWSVAPRARLGFLLWFSGTEQVLRYHAVRDNRFARVTRVPDRLLSAADPYEAYLYENVVPGRTDAAFKDTGRLLATEGAVAAVMHRWVTSSALQAAPVDESFYTHFGVRPADLTPLDIVYLKLFAAIAGEAVHDLASLIRAYESRFPGDAEALHRVLREAGIPAPIPPAPEIWLASRHLMTGTTLFDQYRGLPRTHTFDLNAASAVDLRAVPGVTVALANDLVRAAPFDRLDAVERVPGMTPAILSAMREMAAAMERLRAATVEDQAVNRLRRVVLFAAERAAAWLCVAAALGAMAYGLVRRLRFVRLALDGMAAALLVLGLSWIVDTDPAWTLFAPLAAFGVPAALWLLAYRRAPREALRAIAAWTMTAVPAWLIAHPLF